MRSKADVVALDNARTRNNRQSRAMTRAQILREERVRIMQDVHDGLGGLLIQAANIADRENSSSRLRNVLSVALTDLRLIVASLNPVNGKLDTLLADFRHLHTRMCIHDPCDYHWHVDSISNVDIGPTRSLSVLRILQEALANIARHSGATQALIDMKAAPSNTLCLRIRDNGVGIRTHRAVGHGLASIQRRARELGGTLVIRDADPGPGTVVTVTVPCQYQVE